MKKVAIYARVSTEHEAQLSALENQIQYYDELIEKNKDWVLVEKYIDEGITGTSINKRIRFMKMIEDAKNGCFDLIITREVSRFARNTVDTLQVTRELKKYNVEVYFTEDNIRTFNDEDGELKLTLMATLAQNESKKISQRVKAGQKISYLNGVIYGNGNILGYNRIEEGTNKNKTVRMIINEEEAETVKFIFESFLKGLGTTKIKYELEKKSIPTATGLNNWSVSTITRILQNPFYCGTIKYRKYFVKDFLEQKARKNNGEVEQVEIEGKHEPIISKEDFNKVQDIMKERTKHITPRKKIGHGAAESVWSKKLICKCGSRFNRKLYHSTNGIRTYCYQCYNVKNNGSIEKRTKEGLDITNACDMPVIAEWKLSLIANRIFDLFCRDKERIIKMVDNLLEKNIDKKEETNNSELNNLKNKIINNNKKLDKLVEMYLNNLISKEIYINKKEIIDQSIYEVNSKINKLSQNKKENGSGIEYKLKELKNIIKYNLSDENLSISDSIIESIIQKVIVTEEGFIYKINTVNKANEETLIAKIIITKDDVNEYTMNNKQYKKLRLKKPIIVKIVI